MTAPRTGWAFGDRGEWNGEFSRYLTILGSAYQRPALYATEDEARAALARHPMRNNPHMNMQVAHVTEFRHPGVTGPRGYAYRITDTIGN
jgi:hypothetical protein